MTKQEFLNALGAKLAALPKQELEERLNFYDEMIDDGVEEGLSEEQAVDKLGSVEEVAAQIIADIPFFKIAKERFKFKRPPLGWEKALLILGAPLWIALAAAAIAVVVSIYAVIFSIAVAAWAVDVAFAAGTLGAFAVGLSFAFSGNAISGAMALGAGLIFAGLAILLFFCAKSATKITIFLSGKIAFYIKKLFTK